MRIICQIPPPPIKCEFEHGRKKKKLCTRFQFRICLRETLSTRLSLHLLLLLLFYDYYIFRTLSYVGNVQLVKFPSLCCLDNDYLSLSILLFFLCVCGGCCIVQFPSHIPHPNCGVHRETIFSPLLHLRPQKQRGCTGWRKRKNLYV